MSRLLRAFTVRQSVAAGLCATALSLPSAVSAQVAVPATACDAALANPDLHPIPDMPLEDGATAFGYGAGAFVSGGSGSVAINVGLAFDPGPGASIRLTALDPSCAGTSSATVFTVTFDQLVSRQNVITVDGQTGAVALNGMVQQAVLNGSPRYVFVDVWDGELPSLHASHSYVIDLLQPSNPTLP